MPTAFSVQVASSVGTTDIVTTEFIPLKRTIDIVATEFIPLYRTNVCMTVIHSVATFDNYRIKEKSHGNFI